MEAVYVDNNVGLSRIRYMSNLIGSREASVVSKRIITCLWDFYAVAVVAYRVRPLLIASKRVLTLFRIETCCNADLIASMTNKGTLGLYHLMRICTRGQYLRRAKVSSDVLFRFVSFQFISALEILLRAVVRMVYDRQLYNPSMSYRRSL